MWCPKKDTIRRQCHRQRIKDRRIKTLICEQTIRFSITGGYHEARDKVNQARYALMNDQLLPVRGKRNRFADYCNEWLYLKRSSVKPSTFVKYTTILEKYIKPDLGQYFSEAVSEILVEQFSYRLIHERGLSPKTVRDILSVLHSILNYTTKQNPLAKPVDIVYPRQYVL